MTAVGVLEAEFQGWSEGVVAGSTIGLQLGIGLTHSAPSNFQKLVHVEYCPSLKHILNGTTQLMGQDGERFALAMLSL